MTIQELIQDNKEKIERSLGVAFHIALDGDKNGKHKDAYKSHWNSIDRYRQFNKWLEELDGGERQEDERPISEGIQYAEREIESYRRAMMRQIYDLRRIRYSEEQIAKNRYIVGYKNDMAKYQQLKNYLEELERRRAE